jgi:hypothetical protein
MLGQAILAQVRCARCAEVTGQQDLGRLSSVRLAR